MKGKGFNYYSGMDGENCRPCQLQMDVQYLKGEMCSWIPTQAHLEVMGPFGDTCTKSEVQVVAKSFKIQNKTTQKTGLILPDNFVRKSIQINIKHCPGMELKCNINRKKLSHNNKPINLFPSSLKTPKI